MHSVIAKLTVKNQATVPKDVRKALRLKPHDQILYEILDDGYVRIRRAEPFDIEYLKSVGNTLNEWHSDEDEKAYKNL